MPIYANENLILLSTYHSSSWLVTNKDEKIFYINENKIKLFSSFIFLGNIVSLISLLSLIRIIPWSFSIFNYINIIIGIIPIVTLIFTVLLFTSAPKFYSGYENRVVISKRNTSISFEFYKIMSALCILISTACLLLDYDNNYSDIIVILIGTSIFAFLFIHWMKHFIAVININSKLFGN
jgi:hypothetical protein